MGTPGDNFNIVIAGVGGQGNVLACQMIGMTAVEEGWQVSAADTFGVSQRGGAVMSHLRLSRDKPCGPLIPAGQADIAVGLEPLETVRVLRTFGGYHTRVLMNSRPNYPLAVLCGEAEYPPLDELRQAIREHCREVVEVPADQLARQGGSWVTQNTVMTGALAGTGWMPFAIETYERVIKSLFSGRVHQLNLAAFRVGVRATSRKTGAA
ncbi:MAG: indolepyruvate ferredoxin oxidoreductase [Clostridia bacterium]|nr:MAG: indolepyruvate ferredoxin oxidoreductase [Clostridia bacterium]